MKVGIGADHGGFEMKQQLAQLLAEEGNEVIDFGNKIYDASDDYPDFATPLLALKPVGQSDPTRNSPDVADNNH